MRVMEAMVEGMALLEGAAIVLTLQRSLSHRQSLIESARDLLHLLVLSPLTAS